MAISIADRNRKLWEAIKKGDISVSDLITETSGAGGGYLQREEEDRFMQKVYASTPFLQQIRKVDMLSPRRRINKIGITGNFLHEAPSSGTALDAAKRSKVFTQYVDMTTSELIGSMYIPYDVLEDNLEKGMLEDTIMDAILPPKIGRDLEKLCIQGDSTSMDSLLGTFDGVLKQLADANANEINFNQSTGLVTDELFETMLEELPDEYRELHDNLRYYFHWRVGDRYVMYRRQRETVEGDSIIGYDHLAQYGFRGIPMQMTSQMPAVSGLLTPPQNIILGFQRGIQFETARDIEARVIIIVVTMRVALGIEENDACVVADGINYSGTTTTTTG